MRVAVELTGDGYMAYVLVYTYAATLIRSAYGTRYSYADMVACSAYELVYSFDNTRTRSVPISRYSYVAMPIRSTYVTLYSYDTSRNFWRAAIVVVALVAGAAGSSHALHRCLWASCVSSDG